MSQYQNSAVLQAILGQGGAGRSADTRYDYSRPWEGTEESKVSQSLNSVMNMTAEQISSIRPPLPRTQLFPPRFGYRVDAIGIADVMDVNATYPGARIDYSGTQSGFGGSSTPSLANW